MMKNHKTVYLLWVCLLLLLLAPANVLADSPPSYYVDETKLPFEPLLGLDSEQIWGIHKGAGYRIEVPVDWNGTLVMWAHGYRESPGVELELTVTNPPLRPWLVANGYAWAASSYSRNNYDVAAGAQDTHALTQLFNSKVGKPDRVYIAGNSMGGHVVATAIEQWPNTYDGALPMCGILGDYAVFDYYLDFNVVAQALAGVQAQYPPSDDYLDVTVPFIKSQLEQVPDTFPFTLSEQGQALAAVTKHRSGGERPLFNQAFLYWNGIPGDVLFGVGTRDDILSRVRGIPVDNAETVYQFDGDPTLTPKEEFLNANVLRVERDPQARHPNGLANVPAVNGRIKSPVLTLHTIGDLFVPISMEQIYAQRVAEQGASDLLVQRAIRSLDHCDFTPEEVVSAFTDLIAWVESGDRPEGDDLLNPAIVADPAFGCKFTSEDRLYPLLIPIPPCPSAFTRAANELSDAENVYLPVILR